MLLNLHKFHIQMTSSEAPEWFELCGWILWHTVQLWQPHFPANWLPLREYRKVSQDSNIVFLWLKQTCWESHAASCTHMCMHSTTDNMNSLSLSLSHWSLQLKELRPSQLSWWCQPQYNQFASVTSLLGSLGTWYTLSVFQSLRHVTSTHLIHLIHLILHINPSVIDSEDDIEDAHRDKHITLSKFHDAASITYENVTTRLSCREKLVSVCICPKGSVASLRSHKSRLYVSKIFQVMRIRIVLGIETRIRFKPQTWHSIWHKTSSTSQVWFASRLLATNPSMKATPNSSARTDVIECPGRTAVFRQLGWANLHCFGSKNQGRTRVLYHSRTPLWSSETLWTWYSGWSRSSAANPLPLSVGCYLAFDTFVVNDKLDVLWCSLLAESTQVAYSHRGKTRQHVQNLAAWKGMERPRFSHCTCFAKSIWATANNNVKASAKVRIPAILSKRDLVWEQIGCLHFGATVAFNAAPIQLESISI